MIDKRSEIPGALVQLLKRIIVGVVMETLKLVLFILLLLFSALIIIMEHMFHVVLFSAQRAFRIFKIKLEHLQEYKEYWR